ncbi:hypothetical protein [Vaginella massiliensis]|uniref:hypothetical protein n=1 Tax=Vaginella massiliensis TaxID=1816680 RepID=UPI0008392A3C|nr:hypothetical protein [Vaginella massiliensis]
MTKKNNLILLLIQGILSLLSGILISKMSWIGKIGISVFYRDYLIFRSWWKTALVIFAIMLFLNLVFYLFQQLIGLRASRILAIVLFHVGLFGLMYTFYDFNYTAHRYLKSSFHFGAYLFWINWMTSCIFFILKKKQTV